MTTAERWRRLALLLGLYFCQGLPFGFQVRALPLYLREHGTSLGAIGLLVPFLGLPWLLKLFWAPLVDRYGSERIGRRKSWILPLQAGLMLTALIGAALPPSRLPALLVVVFVMNLFAAAQDTAVDGLAVDLLQGRELGGGNAAQVAGYKLGMTVSGGVLVWASGSYGWRVIFLGMAALTAAVWVLTAFLREPSRTAAGRSVAPPTLRETLQRMGRALRLPGAASLLVFVATFDAGETLVDRMFKHFLQDAGFTSSQLGLWLGTYGMAASILGSVLGGVSAAWLGLYRTLVIAGVLRAFAVAAEWGLAQVGAPGAGLVISVSVLEHLCGGLLTTAVFAFMMSRVDPRIGATHYTLFATVELLGKTVLSASSGALAQWLGYSTLFLVGTVLSFAFLVLLIPVRRLIPAGAPPAGAPVPAA